MKGNKEKLFWSPAARWSVENNEVIIEIFKYRGLAVSLFPKFYFLTQQGISEKDLIEHFGNDCANYVRAFTRDLINKQILVTGIIGPKELFYTQKKLYDNKLGESIKFVKDDYETFKKKQINRILHWEEEDFLLEKGTVPDLFKKRHTTREFNDKVPVTYKAISSLLEVLSKKDNDTFFYPSAGGIYPIDVYIYIKKGRVSDLKEGFYYYNSVEHKLSSVAGNEIVTENEYFVTNKAVFKSSAFSIFFVYNGDVNIPRYDGNGYYFGVIDMGIMVENIYLQSAIVNLGACSIGDMDFLAIEKKLSLGKNRKVLHAIEIGLEVLDEK